MNKQSNINHLFEGLEAGALAFFYDSLGVIMDFFEGELTKLEYWLLEAVLGLPIVFSSLILSWFY